MEKENLDMSSGYMEDQNGNILKYPMNNLEVTAKVALVMNPFAHPSICIKRDSLNILYDKIRSQLQKNFPNDDYELIFVNDGSKDNSLSGFSACFSGFLIAP